MKTISKFIFFIFLVVFGATPAAFSMSPVSVTAEKRKKFTPKSSYLKKLQKLKEDRINCFCEDPSLRAEYHNIAFHPKETVSRYDTAIISQDISNIQKGRNHATSRCELFTLLPESLWHFVEEAAADIQLDFLPRVYVCQTDTMDSIVAFALSDVVVISQHMLRDLYGSGPGLTCACFTLRHELTHIKNRDVDLGSFYDRALNKQVYKFVHRLMEIAKIKNSMNDVGVEKLDDLRKDVIDALRRFLSFMTLCDYELEHRDKFIDRDFYTSRHNCIIELRRRVDTLIGQVMNCETVTMDVCDVFTELASEAIYFESKINTVDACCLDEKQADLDALYALKCIDCVQELQDCNIKSEEEKSLGYIDREEIQQELSNLKRIKSLCARHWILRNENSVSNQPLKRMKKKKSATKK